MLRTSSIFFFLIILASSSVSAEEKFRIGLINPLSGVLQDLGEECRFGYELALKEMPDAITSKVDFVHEDDASTVKGAVSAYKKLSQDSRLLATSVFGSFVALALSPLVEKSKIPLFALSAHPKLLDNQYAFSSWQSADYESEAFLNYILNGNFKRVAIITLENDYTVSITEMLKSKLASRGVDVVFSENVIDASGYRSLVPRINTSKAEIVFFSLFGPSFITFVKKLHEQGYKGERLSIQANSRDDILRAIGKSASEGIVFFGPDYSDSEFRAKFENSVYENKGKSYAHCCYLALKAIETSLEGVINTATPLSKEALYRNMLELKSVSSGKTSVPVRGRRIEIPFIKTQVLGGALKVE